MPGIELEEITLFSKDFLKNVVCEKSHELKVNRIIIFVIKNGSKPTKWLNVPLDQLILYLGELD